MNNEQLIENEETHEKDWTSEEEIQKIWNNLHAEVIPLSDIYLDPQNPRISVKKTVASDIQIPQENIQEHCMKQLERLSPKKNDELEEKIHSQGFRTQGEMLFVRPLEGCKGYLALEGNRRTWISQKISKLISAGIYEDNKPDSWKETFDAAHCLVYKGDNPRAAEILQSHRHLGNGQSDWEPIRRAEQYRTVRESAVKSGKEEPTANDIASILGENDATSISKMLNSLDGFSSANQIISSETKKFDESSFGWFSEVIFQGDKRLREGYLGWDKKERAFKNKENVEILAGMINSSEPQIINQSKFRDKIKQLIEPDGTPSPEWENMETDSSYNMEQAIADIQAQKKKEKQEKEAAKATLAGYNKELPKVIKLVQSLPSGKGGASSSKLSTLLKTKGHLTTLVDNTNSTIATVELILEAKGA